MKSIFKTRNPQETIDLGIQLASRLTPGSTVLLFGDLGSGKTQFTKGIAKGLGINELIKSPTFTYVHQHELSSGHRFYHYDLYRLKTGQGLESIGLHDTVRDLHAVNVIEWADRMGGYEPQEYIRVNFRSLADHHEISINFNDRQIAPEELVDRFWQDWMTPLHVQKHCKQVAKVAQQIGQAYIDQNILVNLDLLNTAALLHDMARVCDFKSLDRDKFSEEITEEKWARWVDLRKQFEGMHHADIACGALAEEGFTKTAEVIRLHNFVSILEEPEKFSYLEVSIVYYADKRVKHDEIVSMQERFDDFRHRYGEHQKLEAKKQSEAVKEATFELERQLFEQLRINPESIK